MNINEFIEMMPEELSSFFEETDSFLAAKGYKCEIMEAKSGPVVSYIKDKKTLLNYVCRKTGVKIRLYAAHIGIYDKVLDTFPEKMKKDIIKATDCKKLNGLDCTPACSGGYRFRMDGFEYKKCRSMAFLQTLSTDSCGYIKKLIELETET